LVVAAQYGPAFVVDRSTGEIISRIKLSDAQLSVTGATLVPNADEIYLNASYSSEGDRRAPIVIGAIATTGHVRWLSTLRAGADLPPSPPVVVEELVYVADVPSDPESGVDTSSVYALDRDTGSVR